jgi:CHAT domain-containing protein
VALWLDQSGGKQQDVSYLTGPEATEAAFKREAPGRRMLHLATHGFFLGGCSGGGASTRGIGGVAPSGPEETTGDLDDFGVENPLLLSGLALAGANRRSEVTEGEDGVLTAEEIASLDLTGVDVAVLSACDTGVGEIRAGEGVFGLRRAMQIAGVRSQILSLWSVDDDSTQLWMEALYRGLLEEGLDAAGATRAAGKAVLESRRDSGDNTHPFYWAAFVANGG